MKFDKYLSSGLIVIILTYIILEMNGKIEPPQFEVPSSNYQFDAFLINYSTPSYVGTATLLSGTLKINVNDSISIKEQTNIIRS